MNRERKHVDRFYGMRHETISFQIPNVEQVMPGRATRLHRAFMNNSLVRNGLPAMAGAFAAAATAGVAAGPALGVGVLAGLGFTWLNEHNRPS